MTSQNLNIDTLDYRDHKDLYFKLKEEEIETLDIDFGLYPNVTRSRYLDVMKACMKRWCVPTNSTRTQI